MAVFNVYCKKKEYEYCNSDCKNWENKDTCEHQFSPVWHPNHPIGDIKGMKEFEKER